MSSKSSSMKHLQQKLLSDLNLSTHTTSHLTNDKSAKPITKSFRSQSSRVNAERRQLPRRVQSSRNRKLPDSTSERKCTAVEVFNPNIDNSYAVVHSGASALKRKNANEVVSKPPAEHRKFLREQNSSWYPSTLEPVASYITSDGSCLSNHAALHGTIVLLPGLGDVYGVSLPIMPPPHNVTEDYCFTDVIPTEVKPEGIKKVGGWVCSHNENEVKVRSISGETIHKFRVYPNRGKDDVRMEILELERLMKGLSTDGSKTSVVLYQNEINELDKMVKETLSMVQNPEVQQEPPDPTGLRKFVQEYETALQALKHRHRECINELKKMEEMEFSLS